ncbi:hypothetical protein C8R46DRAFT_1234733 [Mycena filopes]|nr:hypothetical protein C8R46DRAFT_1234733 [Mycena filopes]
MANKKPFTRYDNADDAGKQSALLGDTSPIGSEDEDDDRCTLVDGAALPGEHDDVDEEEEEATTPTSRRRWTCASAEGSNDGSNHD